MNKFYTSVARMGDSLLVRGYQDGIRFNNRVKFDPLLFLPSKEKTDWTTMDGSPVTPLRMGSMKEARDFMNRYSDVPNFDFYGNTNYVVQYINEEYPGTIEFDRDRINVTTIDIEVASDDGFPEPDRAEREVIAITCKNNIDNIYYVWGMGDFTNKDKEKVVVYYKCSTEHELLLHFVNWWNTPVHTPDIVTGWNSYLFDMIYIVNRCNKIIGEKSTNKLSPWGRISSREIHTSMKGKITAYDPVGIAQLDYLDLFKKFTFQTQESYKLDHIAYSVLGDNKLEFDGTLHTLYKTDYQKFIEYNIKDVELVDRLEDKLGLITLALTMAYKGGVNYRDVLGTCAIWDAILYRYMFKKRIAVPQNKEDEKADLGGGYVKETQNGLHDWVVSFDLNSLYPHIIMQYNMGTDTIVDRNLGGMNVDSCLDGNLKSVDGYSVDANGQLYTNEYRGMMPTIIEQYYAERKETKTNMLGIEQQLADLPKNATPQERYKLEKEISHLHNNQMAIKLLMNSLYGAMGNKYFRYYDLRIADGITSSGRLIIRWAERAMNSAMNQMLGTDKDYVIAIDTDSLYINMSSLVDKYKPKDPIKFLDKACQAKFEPILEQSYQDLADRMGSYQNRMVMKREVIAERGVWVAKKRYILNVWNSEGVQFPEPKLKMMGIEAVKSSTPAVCRDKYKEMFKIIMNGTESQMQDAIQGFKEEFFHMSPLEISAPRSVNNLSKFYDDKNVTRQLHNDNGGKIAVPMHVRASCVYNWHIKDKGLDKMYPLIADGDKVRLLFIKKPNMLKTDIIAFPDFWPSKLGVDEFIDYEKQFQKTFMDGLQIILDAIRWQSEPIATLEGLFE